MNNRRNKYIDILKSKHLDAILIHGKSNKKYIGALSSSGVYVLVTQNKLCQIMDGRYINAAIEETSGFDNHVYEQGTSYIDCMASILGKNKTIGVEDNLILAKDFINLQSHGFNVILLNNELELARKVKTIQEIDNVKRACQITDEVFKEVLTKIHSGISEREISAWIHFLALRKGASGMAFDTIVTSGFRTCLPHGRPTDKLIEYGDFITLDFGVVYNDYQSDMTRTVCLGKPNAKLEEIYYVVQEAQEKGVQYICSGKMSKEVDAYVRGIISEHGFGAYFTHGLGHGIGLGEGEYPILNRTSTMILEDGMIMSCEPGVYVPGLGGVRIEDDVVIVDGKGKALNQTTKNLIVLEDY